MAMPVIFVSIELLQGFDAFSRGFWQNLTDVDSVATDQNTTALFVDGFSNDTGLAGEEVGVAFDFSCRVAAGFVEMAIGGVNEAY